MRTSRQAVVLVLSLLVLPAALAEDSNPFEPPEARIKPPSGVTAHARILPPSGDPVDSRLKPPGGQPTTDSRILPPSGVTREEPTFFDMFLEWLRVQARIGVPIG